MAGAVERAAKLGVSVDDLNEAWRARSPLRRMVTPQDVANLALFLASDESAAMTGQAINLTPASCSTDGAEAYPGQAPVFWSQALTAA